MAEVERSDHPSLEEFHGAKISVWWDIENCCIPKNNDGLSVAHNISSALEQLNYYGDISIRAYGNISLITSKQKALDKSGIKLIHLPGKNDVSNKMITDMLLWSYDNPSPANYLLISGDEDFTYALANLTLRSYNILLAHSDNVAICCDEVKTIWKWTSLLDGEPPYVSKPITSQPDIGKLQIKNEEKQKWKRTGETSGDCI